MSTLLIPSSTILPPPNLIYFIGSSKKGEREEYKTTFSSPKQEHLLIVEVTVSVQPHALNTTLLVLMMRRMEGGRKVRETIRDGEKRECMEMGGLGYFFLLTLFTPTPSPILPPPPLLRKCTSLSTSILKGSSKLSNLSAILYIIACLNPHWNLGCYATIIWPLVSSPRLHFLSHCFLSFLQRSRGWG